MCVSLAERRILLTILFRQNSYYILFRILNHVSYIWLNIVVHDTSTQHMVREDMLSTMCVRTHRML